MEASEEQATSKPELVVYLDIDDLLAEERGNYEADIECNREQGISSDSNEYDLMTRELDRAFEAAAEDYEAKFREEAQSEADWRSGKRVQVNLVVDDNNNVNTHSPWAAAIWDGVVENIGYPEVNVEDPLIDR